MKRTISAMRGPGSLNHNRRSFTAENVDPKRSSLNVVYRDEPIQKVYHELFDEAVKRYNAKQKRKDRCITDYYEHLRTGKQEKLFHELIVQIGNKDDMGVLTENGALAKELLDEYMQGFQERNPTLRVFGAFLHMDEATPHLHIDFVPYVSGWKGKGLDTKVSLKQALKALGFAGGSKRESELNQWINAEKEQLAAVMERHGIEWEQKGTHEEHLSVLDFKKQERSKEVAALEAAKQECQTDLTEMQEQLETAQTAVEAAEQRVQKAELTYQKQSQKLNKLAPIMEGLENLSAQYSQRPEEWVPEAATFETAKSYREKKAMPLIQKLVKVLFTLHRKYWEVKDGGTLSTSIAEFWNGKILWCTPTDITSCSTKYIYTTESKITESGLKASSATLLPKGALLLCSRATIGEVRIAGNTICTNQGFNSLVVHQNISNEWLYYMVHVLKFNMLEKAIGSTFLEISKKDLAELDIIVPEFTEQKAIAQVLSDMDSEIELLEKKLAKYQQIKQGMMQELLTGRIRLV